MDKELRWKLGIVLAVIAVGVYFAIPWARPFPKGGKMRYGLDLQGGTELLYQLKELPEAEKDKFKGQDLASQIIAIISERIDAQGVKQPRIQKQGLDRILIQLPGADEKETEDLRKLIETSGHLMFRLVATKELADQYLGKSPPAGHEWIEYAHTEEQRDKDLVMKDDGYNLGGEIIEKASPSQDRMGFPAVGFNILPGYQDQFYELTWNNSEAKLGQSNGRRMAIIMDGKVISAPVIKDGIRDDGIITGGENGFDLKEQKRLVTVLNSGRFPVDLDFEEMNFVGPGIGSDSIERGIRAVLVAGVAVLLFMALYYLGSGLVANFALCLNLVLILAAMNMMSATLTLPGIAGVLLTVGMAVDANILIFERIREEKAKGKTLHQSLKNGYERAVVTIVDANVTTLITAAILWMVGTGPVRGFAVTLSMGILASMFTAIFVTRVIFELLLMGRVFTQFKMLQILSDSKFDFVRWAGKAVLASCVVIAAGMLVFSYRGERNLGVDFRQGTVVDFQLQKPIPVSEVRARIAAFQPPDQPTGAPRYQDAEVQELWELGGGEDAAHRFEIRTSWSEKPDMVRRDIETLFADDLVPGAFENPPGVDSVSNRQFEFTFYFDLESEKRVSDLEAILLPILAETLPEAAPAGAEAKPGALSGTGADTNRPFATALKFESRRFPTTLELPGIQERVDAFLAALRPRLEREGECRVKGAFPKLTPEIRRFADLTLTLNFIKPVAPEVLKKVLEKFDEAETSPSEGAPSKTHAVSTKAYRSVGGAVENPWQKRLELWKDAVRKAIKEEDIGSNLSEPVYRAVGISPIVASELIEKGILAILFSLLAIVIYVAVRFQVGGLPQVFQGSGLWNFVKEMLYRARYGIAAIAALAHDVLITLGVLAVAGELDLIEVKVDLQILAAFLTIIGYSLNDTIVIFDRIRENLTTGEKMNFHDLVNVSLNQTLSRTILTSGTTFLTVFALFLLGGGVIRGFSFTLMIGVVVGTYSTIYIATPMLLMWEKLVRPKTG